MEYSDALVYRIIERITVLSKKEICIRFIGGFEPPSYFTKKQAQKDTEKEYAACVLANICFFFKKPSIYDII